MIINEQSNNNLSGFYVIFNGSVQNETIGNRGISHLMEHMMHNRNKNMYSIFDSHGISHNAFTSGTDVVFYMTGLDEYVNKFKHDFLTNLKSFNTLSESKFALKNIVTEEEFQKEKRIVLQEYLDGFNDQSMYHHDMAFRKYLNNYGPIGEWKDLTDLTYESAIQYFKQYLSNPTKIVNISKNHPFEESQTFNPINQYPVPKLGKYDFSPLHKKYNFNKTSVLGLSDVVNENIPELNVALIALSNGLNSPLYLSVREKYNLAYFLNFSLEPLTNRNGILTFQSLTDNKENADKLIKIFNYVCNNADKFITQKRFDTVRRMIQIDKQTTEINNHLNLDKHLEPTEWNVEDKIEGMSRDNVIDSFSKLKFYINRIE